MAFNKKPDEPRVNHQIKTDKVRLVGATGEMLGVVPVEDAIRRATSMGLDLVEVSPNAEPPVCKILDYGKYKYEAQKKANEARKKQKIIHIKEIKIRPNIGDHDFDIKMRNLLKFLEAGDKVKVTLRFRGREMAHLALGLEIFNKVKEVVQEHAKIEAEPKMEGRQAIMILAPIK